MPKAETWEQKMATDIDTFSHLVRSQILLWNACNKRVKTSTSLPLARFEVLRTVEQLPLCRVNDIAEQMLITVGAASKLVDRLELSRYLQRRPNPTDSRSSLISLTPEGRIIIKNAEHELTTQLKMHLSGVDQHSLNNTLTLIEQNIHTSGIKS